MLIVVPLILSACMFDLTGKDTGAKPDDDPVIGTPSCDEFAAEAGFGFFVDPDMYYVGQSQFSVPVDMLKVELFVSKGADPEPHSYWIRDTNYADCHTCVTLSRGCDELLENCDKVLLATGGTLEITDNGGVGDAFGGTLTNGQFVEVLIDESTNQSTVLEGGETCTVANQLFLVVLLDPDA